MTQPEPKPSTPSERPIEAVFFYHVPKTAGSTVLKSLSNRFPGRVFHPQKSKGLGSATLLAHRKFRMNGDDAARSSQAQAIAGHWASLSLISGRESRFHKVCFWRQPADFVISYYNWHMNRRRDTLSRPVDFKAFTRYLMRNNMARHFLLYCRDVSGLELMLMSDWRKFEIIAEAARDFDVFEDIAGVDRFIASLGITKLRDENVVPKERKGRLSLAADEVEALTRRNAVDHYVSRLSRGEDRETVIAEARANLSHTFSPTDVWETLASPYYRFRVLVLPRLPNPFRRAPAAN